jgi:hypothetical protein
MCRRILEEADGTADLLDVEPLLDPSTTVLHVLGPADLDLAVLRARFRSLFDFDVVFEPVGWEAGSGGQGSLVPASAGPGRCGDCDCGDGGCSRTAGKTAAGTSATAVHAEAKEHGLESCATSAHTACSSCGVSRFMAEKRPARV